MGVGCHTSGYVDENHQPLENEDVAVDADVEVVTGAVLRDVGLEVLHLTQEDVSPAHKVLAEVVGLRQKGSRAEVDKAHWYACLNFGAQLAPTQRLGQFGAAKVCKFWVWAGVWGIFQSRAVAERAKQTHTQIELSWSWGWHFGPNARGHDQ